MQTHREGIVIDREREGAVYGESEKEQREPKFRHAHNTRACKCKCNAQTPCLCLFFQTPLGQKPNLEYGFVSKTKRPPWRKW